VFRDAPGPALLLVPRGAVAGIERAVAIAVAPVSVEDYAEFLRQTRRSAGRCPGTTGSYADCLSYGDAQAYAAWVSEQTGARYRLPSLAEWRALVGWSPEGPRPEWPAVWEWTQSCELERVNPVGRAVSNVGRRLQGKPIDRRTHVCDGRYTVRPDQAPRAQDEEYAARGLGLRLLREY
jgi:formylglycine-generating enzyme required for sulfatase activity